MSIPICAIDPGMGGGIAFYVDDQTVSAVKMPRSNKEFWDYVVYLKGTYGNFMTFIERVSVWRGDNDTPGKAFGIEKLLANYNSLVAILEASNIPVVEVSGISWQKKLMLYFPKEDRTKRKNRYKRYAANKYPTIKPTLKTADALCILSFAREKIVTNPDWVLRRVRNREAANLFITT